MYLFEIVLLELDESSALQKLVFWKIYLKLHMKNIYNVYLAKDVIVFAFQFTLFVFP